jgi:CheY-like chemotaxis protein/HPt (histidine-containing phosphotransfer) domain-containing protein
VAGHPYSIALIDLQLPDGDGEKLGRQIKEDPELAETLLVLMTPLSERDRAKQIPKTLFSSYLVKPIRLSRLQDELNQLVSGQPLAIHSIETSMEARSLAFEPAIANSAVATSGQTQPANLKILIAEDNLINQKVAIRQLNSLGYAADVVTNGEEALQQLAQVSYDIVLMDCQMPILDGYGATQRLRQQEGQQQHTIVIAMTASAMPEDRDRCLEAGMDDFLSKPVLKEELMAMLERWTAPKFQDVDISDTTLELAAAPNTVVHLDCEYLQQLSEGDTGFEQELLQIFIQNVSRNLAENHRALQNRDFSAIAANAHQIKGSSGNIGALNLHQLSRELEDQSRQQNSETTSTSLVKLEQALSQFSAYVNAHYASKTDIKLS